MAVRRLVASFPFRRPGFDPRPNYVGFVVDIVALGQVFSGHLDLPCQFSFRRLLHTHHPSSGAGTISQLVADVTGGLSHPTPRKKPFGTLMPVTQTGSDVARFRFLQECMETYSSIYV
jgi:hypothetical protein